MKMPLLRQSSPQIEGAFHASKWLKHQLLIDEEEMKDLFAEIGPCYICPATGPVNKDQIFLTQDLLLAKYAEYINSLKEGRAIDEKEMRRLFCNYLTCDLEALYGVPVAGDRVLIKVSRPVVQMQFHHFFASTIDGKFHSMVMTKESITWGVQFSYPQIFEDPHTHQYTKTNDISQFPNTELFKNIIRWVRLKALPTPFVFQGVRTRVPFRLGKQCFSWIHKHTGLKERGITVEI